MTKDISNIQYITVCGAGVADFFAYLKSIVLNKQNYDGDLYDDLGEFAHFSIGFDGCEVDVHLHREDLFENIGRFVKIN